MYKKVMAAVNEYTNSEAAARFAVTLARACGAGLALVHAAPEPVDRERLRRAEASLGRLFMEAGKAGVAVEQTVVKGEPVPSLTRFASEWGADIVFAATRHAAVERRLFVRSVARELMLRLPCAAVTVRVVGLGRERPGHILLPLRGGLGFQSEMAYFSSMLALGLGAKVTLFHMSRPVKSFFSGEVFLGPAERDGRIPKDVREFSEYLDKMGVACERKTARRVHGGSITAHASEHRNDLIVMGASRRGFLARLVRESPVEAVLSGASCNVMIFKPGRAR